MIIFGLSVFYFGAVATGEFHCPHCGGDREFKHQKARRFFTLFFLPVIPLNVVGEAVRCRTCRKRFDPAVLRQPTTAQLADALPTGMRGAATVVLRAGGASQPAVQAAVAAVQRAGVADYGVEGVQADLSRPPEAFQEPLRTLAGQLTPQAREHYLGEAVRIGLADGPLAPAERAAIVWLAGTLGMTEAHAAGVITTVEQSVASG